MSVDYYYVNNSKKHYFHTALLGYSNSLKSIGYGPSSRVLSLLISEKGSWKNDSISLETWETDNNKKMNQEYIDIGIEAELLLLEIDGIDRYRERIVGSSTLLHKCAYYAKVFRNSTIISFFKSEYGKEWEKKFNLENIDLKLYYNRFDDYLNRSIILYNP